jgi:hypothetical protein
MKPKTADYGWTVSSFSDDEFDLRNRAPHTAKGWEKHVTSESPVKNSVIS